MLVVADIMTKDPAVASPDTPLGDVIRSMKQCNCRHIPIVENGQLVGIITDRDIRLAMHSPLTSHRKSDDQEMLDRLPVRDCMTPSPLTVEVNDSVVVAAQRLLDYRFGALPVLDNDRLVGIVTTTDILKSYIAHFK